MKYRFLLLCGVAFCSITICHAQKLDTKKERDEMDKFIHSITDDFNDFRRQSMSQFADFVKNPWKEFEGTQPVPKPKPQPVPPIIMDDEEDKQIDSKPIIIEEVVEPIIEEAQPQPLEPIKEVPVIAPAYLNFTFFGTHDKVRFEKSNAPMLKGIDELSISAMLHELSSDENDNLILDCLEIRKRRNLSDWAYLQMLDKITTSVYPDSPNEAQLLLAYIYMQSGYKMRLASNESDLYMLFSSRHLIYEKPSFTVDGEIYYSLRDLPDRLHICQVAFPREEPLSLLVNSHQLFTYDKSTNKIITSDKYPEVRLCITVNKNLLSFYSTYPASILDGNIMSSWAMYANTPMDNNITSSLYTDLKELLNGKTELEATNILLNTIQTGLKYEYDEVIWGNDRSFFSEESLFYPYCDCEDRSILLTRLVRDLLGLNCLLVYYPGHLATAIEYSDNNINGDYIYLDGHKYIIADPTYINAPIGCMIPGVDNVTAKVIRVN